MSGNIKLTTYLKHIQTSKSPISLAFSLIGLLIPVIALYATKGIAILFGLAVLFCLPILIIKKKYRPAYPQTLGISVLSFTIWSVTSLFWTISADLSRTVVHSIPMCMLGGILIVVSLKTLSSNERTIVCQSTVWGFFFGVSLALIDVTTDYCA